MAAKRRNSGGRAVSPSLQFEIRDRILRHAEKIVPEKAAQIRVRFRGAFCYIDAEEPGSTEPMHLIRLSHTGRKDQWSLAFYTYSHEKYETSVFGTGSLYGSPEDGLEIGAIYLR